MELCGGFQMFILAYAVHFTTNEILHMPRQSTYGTFYNVENEESKVVFIKTCQGGSFGFFQSTNTSSLVYKINFGAYGVRTVIQGQHKDGPRSNTTDPALLPEKNRFKPFYFHWANSMMVVGAGTIVGQGPRFQFSNNVTVTVKYMSVRTHSCSMDYILELSCRKV
ncbi:hypothetical protein SNE40_000603 [Patella caerulea]|uniref:Farnesoic acid O-methyl transferase domain-containing protein n=1 Tax=Patella caerulea TaxID=87958 RepID=A0AAN8KF35_PATCE